MKQLFRPANSEIKKKGNQAEMWNSTFSIPHGDFCGKKFSVIVLRSICTEFQVCIVSVSSGGETQTYKSKYGSPITDCITRIRLTAEIATQRANTGWFEKEDGGLNFWVNLKHDCVKWSFLYVSSRVHLNASPVSGVFTFLKKINRSQIFKLNVNFL